MQVKTLGLWRYFQVSGHAKIRRNKLKNLKFKQMEESVKSHLELTVSYDNRDIKVVVQKLSSELPRKIYAVWPKDEELEKYFGNVNLFFIQEVETNSIGNPIIWYKVKYDFKSEDSNIRDIVFEFAVWEQLSKIEGI